MGEGDHPAVREPSRRGFLKRSGALCAAGWLAAESTAGARPAAADGQPGAAADDTEPRRVFSTRKGLLHSGQLPSTGISQAMKSHLGYPVQP